MSSPTDQQQVSLVLARFGIVRALTVVLALGVLNGCVSELYQPTLFDVAAPAGRPMQDSGKARLEGVYSVATGSDFFGSELVALYRKDHFCLYSGSEVIFFETAGSTQSDSSATFQGYYRFVRSEVTGRVTLTISAAEGGVSLFNDHAATAITIRGTYDDPSKGEPPIVLFRTRPVKPLGNFQIMGNCGGGRNSERLGRSENSIEMGRFGEYLGCSGVEVDLHVTKDDSVILMHDDSFSPRTVEGTYILGDVSAFTLEQIRKNSRLIYGEQLPTLYEFLRYVVDSTNYTMVWLDPKVTRDVDRMIAVQQQAIVYANEAVAKRGRDSLKILFGIPDPNAAGNADVASAYLNAPNKNTTPVLCESYDNALSGKFPTCEVWAPRWTDGLQNGNAETIHNHHMKVYPWTIDDPDWMIKFLDGATYDGILSNYPSMLTGLFYQR